MGDIKKKNKSLIKILLKGSVIEAMGKTNLVIFEFANYYAWFNSYNRLKTLDGLSFRYLKKYLIRKFRNKGVRRPVWVAKNFLICIIIKIILNELRKSYFYYYHRKLIKFYQLHQLFY